jgi:hypothetical protein
VKLLWEAMILSFGVLLAIGSRWAIKSPRYQEVYQRSILSRRSVPLDLSEKERWTEIGEDSGRLILNMLGGLGLLIAAAGLVGLILSVL